MSYYKQMRRTARKLALVVAEIQNARGYLDNARQSVDCPMKHLQRIREHIIALATVENELLKATEEIENHLGRKP